MPGAYRTADATTSARRAAAITPSDANNIENTRAIFVGGAGNVRATLVEGGDVVFSGLAAGTVLPIQATRVWATNTTATLLIALY